MDRVIDAGEFVGHGGQVTARQLRTQGTGVEQRGRGGHVVKGRQQLVELHRAGIAVGFFYRQAHGHAHEEDLRQFEAHAIAVDEVTVVQGLQAEIGELLVAAVIQGLADQLQIKFLQARIKQLVLDAKVDVGGQGAGIQLGHVTMGRTLGHTQKAQRFGAQIVQQQARGDVAVVRLALDQGTGGHHQRSVHILLGYTVIQVLQGFTLDQLGIHFR